MRSRGEDEPARSFFGRSAESMSRDEARQLLQEHQGKSELYHRLTISPADDERADDLRELTRQAMRELEDAKGGRLAWCAVEHHNTAHPHVHVMIAGRGEDDTRGVRINLGDIERVRDGALDHCRTRELVREIEERAREYEREVERERELDERREEWRDEDRAIRYEREAIARAHAATIAHARAEAEAARHDTARMALARLVSAEARAAEARALVERGQARLEWRSSGADNPERLAQRERELRVREREHGRERDELRRLERERDQDRQRDHERDPDGRAQAERDRALDYHAEREREEREAARAADRDHDRGDDFGR